MHAVTTLSKPRRVDTGSTAHIQHPCGWWWKVPDEHFLDSEEFKLSEASADSILFPNALVVSNNFVAFAHESNDTRGWTLSFHGYGSLKPLRWVR